MTGQISEMTPRLSAPPTGSWFPFVVLNASGGLDPQDNYIYDLGTDLLTRVSYTALLATGGAGLVGYTPPGTYAELTTLADWADLRPIYAESFRASGDTDREVAQKAFDALATLGGRLVFPRGGAFDFGSFPSTAIAVDISGLRDCVVDFNGCSFTCAVSSGIVPMFYFSNFENIHLMNGSGVQSNHGSTENGAKFIVLDASDSGDPGRSGVRFTNMSATTMSTFIGIQGQSPYANRISDIVIDPDCYCEETFYGLTCTEQGDNISGGFTARNCGREFFPYGINNFDLTITVIHDDTSPAVETGTLIKRYTRNTTNGKLRLVLEGALNPTGNLVCFEHQNDSGAASIIGDIEVSIHAGEGTTDAANVKTIGFRAYNLAGVEQATTAQIWRNIRVAGKPAPGSGNNINFYSLPLYRCVVALDQNFASARTLIVGKNVAFRTSYNTEFFVTVGNLTNAPFLTLYANTMPAGQLDFNLSALCYGTTPTAAVTDATCANYVIQGTVTAGAFTYATNAGLTAIDWDRGTPATFTLDDATNTSFTITAVGTDYDNADSFAVSTVTYNGQCPP